MTTIAPILEAYNALRVDPLLKPEIPEWKQAQVSVNAETYATHDEMLKRLDDFGAARDAWICTQGSVRALNGGSKKLSSECFDGRLILLEAVAGSRSLQLRLASDGWRAVEIEEVSAGGEACLVRHVELAGGPHASGTLVYRVFWKHDSVQGFVPYQARFLGFA